MGKRYKYSIYKKFFLITYCLLLIIFIIFKPVNVKHNVIFFLCLLPVAIYSLILNLKSKSIVFGLINVMNIEMGIAIFLYLYIFKVKITGWRLQLYSSQNANIAFSYLLISECIFLILYFGKKDQGFNYNQIETLQKSEIYSNFLMRIFISGSLIIFLARVDIFVVRDYAVNFDNYAGILFSFGSVLSCLFAKSQNKNQYINLFDWSIMCIYMIIALILALKGYRTYLCAMIFAYIAITIMYKKTVSLRTAFSIAAIGIILYVLMIFAKGIFKGLPPSTYVVSHESSVFFSLIAMIRNVGEHGTENAYINILESLLPSVISHKENMNSGAFMMRYINVTQYANTKVSIGTYFLAEGYLSYGKIGIPIISLIYGSFAMFIDRSKSKFYQNPLLFIVYIYIISQLYGAMWYGAYAFVKNVVYFILLVTLLNLRYIITGRSIKYKLWGEYID